MKQIMFITDGKFAVPNVNGSAIETLIQNFIDVNEKEKKVKVTVACKYNEKAAQMGKKYKYTDFLYYDKINDNKVLKLLLIIRYRLFSLFNISVPKYIYSKQIYRLAKARNYDFFIIEEGDCFSFDFFTKKFGKEKMVSHTHSCWPMNNKFSQIYGSIIVPSVYTMNTLITSQYKYFLTNTSVVQNCVSSSLEYDENYISEFIKKYDIKEKYKILFVGRLSEEKGVLQLIEAFSKIHNGVLIIAGSALFGKKTHTKYEQKVKEAIGNNENIILTGFIPNNKLCNLYKLCDVVVTPSKIESCNMVNLEAILNNKAIITTNCGGIPEYVKDGYNGLVINYDHLIDNLEVALKKMQDVNFRKKFEEYNQNDHNRLSCTRYYYGILNHLNKYGK